MIPNPVTLTIPLHVGDDDVIYVGGTRVTLETVVARHHEGYTPEAIHEAFPAVPVNDLYAVIAYYVTYRQELDAYMARRAVETERRREELEAKYPPQITRAELAARMDPGHSRP